MGCCLSVTNGKDSNQRSVLVVGLDGAGGTSCLYQMVLGKRLETIPTLGVNQEVIQVDGMELACWDIGGLDKLRPLWRQYSRNADGVVFVVDSTDPPRMKLATEELAKLYASTSKKPGLNPERPLLIFANKQDLPEAASGREVRQVLNVDSLPVENFKVFESTVNDRMTLYKGFSWLAGELKANLPVETIEE